MEDLARRSAGRGPTPLVLTQCVVDFAEVYDHGCSFAALQSPYCSPHAKVPMLRFPNDHDVCRAALSHIGEDFEAQHPHDARTPTTFVPVPHSRLNPSSHPFASAFVAACLPRLLAARYCDTACVRQVPGVQGRLGESTVRGGASAWGRVKGLAFSSPHASLALLSPALRATDGVYPAPPCAPKGSKEYARDCPTRTLHREGIGPMARFSLVS